MKLLAHCYISRGGAWANGRLVAGHEDTDTDYLKALYNALQVDYPKFHKMDILAKLAILGDQLLRPHYAELVNPSDDLQLIMANASSSRHADLKFIASYSGEGSPSPSIFVYTLPNILNGELAIRNAWYGENIFFVLPAFDPVFFMDQVTSALQRGNTACLCGWVESDISGNEECFLFLIGNTPGEVSAEELSKTINTYRNE